VRRLSEHDELLAWVERIATYCAQQDGLPRIAGRVLGWLMVCDPPEQSAAEIADAIGASRASLTTNLRLLTSVGFVTTGSRPGGRTTYYRMDDGAWERVVRRQVASLTSLRDITRDGLAVLDGQPRRAARIQRAQDVFDWMAAAFDAAPPIPEPPQKEQ
jgi:DNA-binding transcriptional regulator GbsR (MarR family)